MEQFKIRCSAISDIMGPMGLTEIQSAKLKELTERKISGPKPLTENMERERELLQYRFDNPELPDGAKTHCKKWLKEYLYRRREIVQSKYIDKGNQTEEDGFTLMAVQLKLGMVYKNEQFRENNFICGTDDLFTNGVVYDNKSAWALDTFPMFETVNPKPEYEKQLQGYMELRNCETSILAYTLNNASESMIQQAIRWNESHKERAKIVNNMVFTTDFWEGMKSKYFHESDFKFVEIPAEKRIKTFGFDRNRDFIESVNQRVLLCRKYINSLI